MLPGDYDHSADVRDLSTYALVNNVRREIKSITLDRELANDLPAHVVGGAGLAGGSGTITWASQDDAVENREVSPWHDASWPPKSGDRLRVYVTDGTTSWPRFTGLIDQTKGVVGGEMSSRFIDYRDRLNVSFTREALLRRHVPQYHGGEYRLLGLDFWAFITMALRRAGFYNTPMAGNNAALSVPLQGTAWAHLGNTTAAGGDSAMSSHPEFYQAPWGYAVSRIHADYTPVPGMAPIRSGPVQISFMIAENHSGGAQVQIFFGSSETNRIRLRAFPDRQITAYYDSTPVVTIEASAMGDATIVALVVREDRWTLRTNLGTERTGTYARVGVQEMTWARIWGESGARIAGVIVDEPTTASEFRPLRHTPDATFVSSPLVGEMEMSPRLENRNLTNFLNEICEATLTASWFDEMGILRLMPSDRLRSGTPVQTITTLDDITALAWETSLLHSRSRVHVEWKSASISRSRQCRQELYRGPGSTMESGDTVEVFATPANDEEWFEVHRDPERLNDSNWPRANSAVDSVMGVHYSDSNGERPTSTATTTITAEPIGTVGVKIIHQAGSYPAGVEANLAVSEENIDLRETRKGENLPIIRGRGLGKWVDETYTSPIAGPSSSPELVHDLGPWGGADAAKNIGDFIADRVSRTEPTIQDLTVTYDPRRQLGDVITIEIGILDVTLTAMVVGIHESHQTGNHTQNLDVRIIDATSTRNVTYADLEEAWAGGDYNALQAVWANLTYTDFENNPLEGAPND